MLVKVVETCFVAGHRRRAGEVFDYSGKDTKNLVPVDGGEPTKAVEEVGNDVLRVKLAELGVKVAPATGREKMLAMLAEAESTK